MERLSVTCPDGFQAFESVYLNLNLGKFTVILIGKQTALQNANINF